MTRYHRKRWVGLVVCGVLAGASIGGVLSWRAATAGHKIQRNQQTLCQVIRSLVIKGDAGLDQITYYKHHASELAAQHAKNHAALRRLDCANLAP